MMFVYDRKYNRTAFLSNDAEDGIHFDDDRLTTSIDTAMYGLDLKIPKDTPLAGNIDVGYYIETYTRHNKQLLLAITDIDETGEMINIYCEDSSVLALNSFVDAIEPPRTKEMADYYLNHALEKVDLEILVNECDTDIMLEFGTRQRVLQRIMEIAKAFEMEVSFDVDFSPGSPPKRYVSLLKKRVEDFKGFRVSSDDALYEIQRKINMNNVFTKMLVKGRQQTPVTPEGGDGGGTGGTTNPIGQPPATQYDSSKSGGATAISTTGWSASEVNQFMMNAADPPYVTGAYIDTFLKNFYPDSPLIGAGSLIKEMADYFGVAVGAAMGIWAKETTFGRGEPGKSHYNYGCIRWTPNSLFTPVTYDGSQWDFYPNQRTGIAAWFRLVRYVYIEQGQARYDAFLDKYSPSFENDQSTFKNLMWGTLKSFGYNMSATTVKTNYSKASDSVINLQVPKSTTNPGTPSEPEVDSFVEKAIDRAFELKPLRLIYQWGGNGNPSYDCSGFMQECFRAAGKSIDHRWTTYTMWAQQGGNFRRITRSELKRGDMIMYDTGYTTPGDVNHVGLYLGPEMNSPNSVIHAGDPVGLTQRADSMTVIGYVRVVR